MGQKPARDPNALYAIQDAVNAGHFCETTHTKERMKERGIQRLEVKYVLLHGRRNRDKDEFSEEYKSWKYAIEGSTFDRDKKLRIIVGFHSDPAKADMAVIVSAIDITKRGRDEDR